MLVELRLQNLAIAADVQFELDSGFNVLTGRTGAGKSLVVEALQWLRGERVDRGLVRQGAGQASAEALFDLTQRQELLDRLAELGIDVPEDGMIRLRREVKAEGRSRAWIGARLTTAAVLQGACAILVELQSQHHQLALLSPRAHRDLLDACGIDPQLSVLYEAARERYERARQEVERWQRRRQQIREQRDMLEFQFRELDDAGPRGGEIEELRARVARLSGGVQLFEAVAEAREALDHEDSGALRQLARAQARLESVGHDLPPLAEALDALTTALDLAQDAAMGLSGFADEEESEPQALELAQSRLALLETLCRKYARTENELVELHQQLERELTDIGTHDEVPPELAEGLEVTRNEVESRAKALFRARRTLAQRVAKDAKPLLEGLGMPQATLEFEVEPMRDAEGPIKLNGARVRPGPGGAEDISLRVRTNVGERAGAIERVASGGELSRFGLVLRTLSAGHRRPALTILDEVDAGLSADLGPAVAQRLQAMSAHTQLLVISHLPAVAAAAGRHLVARKEPRGSRTISDVAVIEGDERLAELARMIGGSGNGPLRLARELLRSQRPAEAKGTA